MHKNIIYNKKDNNTTKYGNGINVLFLSNPNDLNLFVLWQNKNDGLYINTRNIIAIYIMMVLYTGLFGSNIIILLHDNLLFYYF